MVHWGTRYLLFISNLTGQFTCLCACANFYFPGATAETPRSSIIYVSTDVETDGWIPGPHSMWSLGSVAYTSDKKVLSTFSVNLKDLPGATPFPTNQKFWNLPENAEALKRTRENQQDPEVAMKNYVAWVKALPGDPVFVASPLAFDAMFVYWYLAKFAGENPFHSSLDIRSYSAGFLRRDFRDTARENYPRHWFDPLPHTHVALDDALEQGAFFINMLYENEHPCRYFLQRRIPYFIRNVLKKRK